MLADGRNFYFFILLFSFSPSSLHFCFFLYSLVYLTRVKLIKISTSRLHEAIFLTHEICDFFRDSNVSYTDALLHEMQFTPSHLSFSFFNSLIIVDFLNVLRSFTVIYIISCFINFHSSLHRFNDSRAHLLLFFRNECHNEWWSRRWCILFLLSCISYEQSNDERYDSLTE